MQISERWLREWVNPALSSRQLADQLTMAGLEVDAVEPVAGDFAGVVVAEIISAEPHPDADKLRVCSVEAGGDAPLQIVCGAPNARVGLKAPLATVGATLPGDFRIKAAKLRGVASQGMLCAAAELGLSEDSDGLLELPGDAPVGEDLRSYLDLEDCSIDIGLTPNRADCLGHVGIAREVGLLNDLPLCEPEIVSIEAQSTREFPVELRDSHRCPRYLGRVIEGVDPTRPSPLWLREKLRRCGLRSIDPIVDITNYLLLELGQPMHAFDLDRLEGGIVVRTAEAGEEIALLNDQTVTLGEDNLVIADHRGAVALAGIMGGAASAVSTATRNILLEAAFFAPEPLNGKARALGLHTDSSHRFERGVDYRLQRRAMERATQLLIDIVGGTPGPIVEAVDEGALPAPQPVALRRARIERLLGVTIKDAEVERILRGLGLGVTATAGGWECAVPSWRFDLRIEADLLEELARVYGYNRLPVTRIRADLEIAATPEARLGLRPLRRLLGARDYSEAITYSFVDPEIQRLLEPDLEPVALKNPISPELSVMRSTLLAGLLRAAQHNLNRQQARVRLFETGLRFRPTADGLSQRPAIALLATGPVREEQWSSPARALDFFDFKGDLEALLSAGGCGAAFSFVAGARAGLHPGQTAQVLHHGDVIGVLGALHPTLQRQLGVDQPVFVAELDLDAVLTARVPAFAAVSRFPEVRRDIAVLVDRALPVAELQANVRDVAGSYLTQLTLFDVYQGKGIDPDRKSVALGLTFQDPSRTLDDQEVAKIIEQVVDSLKENYNAELRG
jgi:phenylalanyl-tRNA synthetase beta chain